jgi:nucleoside-diphosphate-sugar epimerase
MSQTLKAFRQLESMALGEPSISGVVLRYGSFYGPGTSTDSSGKLTDAVRQRQFPLVGDAAGVWSFIHIDDAASATRIAIEIAAPGIYNIVDDDPAEVSVWLPELAKAVGAKPPRHVPEWLARLLVGEAGVSMMTKVRGASNAKARRMLNWQPGYRSWRDGFHRGFSAALASPRVVSAA